MSAAPSVASPRAAAAGHGEHPLARVVFALLAVAAVGAFVFMQRAKHTPTAVQHVQMNPSFTPSGSGYAAREHVAFHLARTDEVTVTVVSLATGADVATLIADHRQLRYRRLRLSWNGRSGPCAAPSSIACAYTERGAPAPPGNYRVRIRLRSQRRTVYSPRSFQLLGPPAGR